MKTVVNLFLQPVQRHVPQALGHMIAPAKATFRPWMVGTVRRTVRGGLPPGLPRAPTSFQRSFQLPAPKAGGEGAARDARGGRAPQLLTRLLPSARAHPAA